MAMMLVPRHVLQFLFRYAFLLCSCKYLFGKMAPVFLCTFCFHIGGFFILHSCTILC